VSAGEQRPLEARAEGGNVLRGDRAGEGPVVVQAHGVTAARRYLTHGSRYLERHGVEAVAYDARGHGESDPAPAGAGYAYAELADDMRAVVDEVAPDRAVVLAGHSMGAHTAAALALRSPDRVAGFVAVGPASRGQPPSPASVTYWDRLADGLERAGIDGFIEAYDDGTHDPEWRDTIMRLARQRLALHRDLGAVARALREVTASVPFEGMEALEELAVPTLVVGSHDEADPGHALAVAEAWSAAIPRARLVTEAPGESPLAWQGGKLSRAIAAFCGEDAVRERLT
jgi:pimeloyl-ACP methyl ester carboxylesterase